jgi:hypothetical protein
LVENHVSDLAVCVGDGRDCFCVLEDIRALMRWNPDSSLIAQAGTPGIARRKAQLANRSPAFRPGLSVLLLFLVLAFASTLHACPMCKDSTVHSDKPTATASAGLDFNRSIYVMLGGFVGVLAVTGRVMHKAVKSSR